MSLFDAYLMVDWSAQASPKTGPDSIWLALVMAGPRGLHLTALENPATRHAARARLADLLADLVAAGRRVLAGFDFPFGYPAGTAAALGLAGKPWRATWEHLAAIVEDAPDNGNNRFDAADRLNAAMGPSAGPFWGHPRGRSYPNLAMTKPAHGALAEHRLCERYVSGPQPVWKLAGIGSVGSQALTGIPVVRALRRDRRLRDACRIWPLETGLVPLDGDHLARHPVVLAEIYPSLVKPRSAVGAVKDALQVQAIAGHFAAHDRAGSLAALFAGAADLTAAERRAVAREEAWVLGVTQRGQRAGAVTLDVDTLYRNVRP